MSYVYAPGWGPRILLKKCKHFIRGGTFCNGTAFLGCVRGGLFASGQKQLVGEKTSSRGRLSAQVYGHKQIRCHL